VPGVTRGHEFTCEDGSVVRVGAPASLPGYTEVEIVHPDGRVLPSYRVTAQLYRAAAAAEVSPAAGTSAGAVNGTVPPPTRRRAQMPSTTSTENTATEAKPEVNLPKPAEAISAYLRASVREGEVGTEELPAPFIGKGERVFIHTRGLHEWLEAEHGPGVRKSDAERILREAGFTGPAVRPLPGLNVNVAFRNAVKPKGVDLKGLAVRGKPEAKAEAKAEAKPKTSEKKKAAPRKRAAAKPKAQAAKKS
jgi:hypothetical protein